MTTWTQRAGKGPAARTPIDVLRERYARGVELLASRRLIFGAFIVLAGDGGRQSRPIM